MGNNRVEEGEPNKKGLMSNVLFSENEGTFMTFKQREKTTGRHLSHNLLIFRSLPSHAASNMIEIN